MKFTLPRQPVYNEKRERKWFAILPVKIEREVRWLETVHVKQVYQIEFGDDGYLKAKYWYNSHFLN